MNKLAKVFVTLLLVTGMASPAKAAIIELSLVVDASGSINSNEFALQIGAYESIFGTATFFDDFVRSGDDLYVNMILFGTTAQEKIAFTHIVDNASANAFAAQISAVTRSGVGSATNTTEATNLAVSSIQNNGIDGDRLVIDVSTDGQPNGGGGAPGAINAATAALAAGVVVNAVGVGSGVGTAFLGDYTMAGGGVFVTATDFGSFQSSLQAKLASEIGGTPIGTPPSTPPVGSVPEPGILVLLSLGLGALGFRSKLSR